MHRAWGRRPTSRSIAAVKGHVLPISWHMSMTLKLSQPTFEGLE
jgi:hypothetical protein